MNQEHRQSESNVRQLATIVFIDLVGYTASMQKNETQTLKMLDQFERSLQSSLDSYAGRMVNNYGDGFLLLFDSASQASRYCLQLQLTCIEQSIPTKMAVHLGDVVIRNDNAFGDGINLASRIESLGIAGSILLSRTVRDQIKNKQDFSLQHMGSFNFKNVSEPMDIYAISNEGLVTPQPFELKGKTKETH